MNDYYEYRFELNPCSETITDVFAAILVQQGFESFIPDDTGLTAYLPAAAAPAIDLQEAIASLPFDNLTVDVVENFIEGRDWNAEWEKNYFKPIVIGNRCAVHSSFHTDVPRCDYDIVIDPKMAFGTGHHATTSLICEQLLQLDLQGKRVVDMGTGTGILAILAAMRGATAVAAIEIDPFAAVNARENVETNHHPEIAVIDGDADVVADLCFKADLFMANINRNVILADLGKYVEGMDDGATVLFSGFYTEDAPMIVDAGRPLGLKFVATTSRDNWCCLKMTYSLS